MECRGSTCAGFRQSKWELMLVFARKRLTEPSCNSVGAFLIWEQTSWTMDTKPIRGIDVVRFGQLLLVCLFLLMVPMIILAITIIFITLNSYVCHFCIALNMVVMVVVFIIFAISIPVMMVQ